MGDGRVVFGAQGVRSPDWAGRGVGRVIARTIDAVQRQAPERVLGADLGAFDSAIEPHDLDAVDPYPVIVDPAARPAPGTIVYHVLAPFERGALDRIWPAWARAPDVALVVTVYDLIPLRHANHYLADSSVSHAYRQRLELLRVADALCVLSDAVAEDLVALAGVDERRVHICGAGPSRAPAPPGSHLPPKLEALADGAVAAVLGEDHRKNTATLIEAYRLLPATLRARMPLLLCGLDPAQPRELPLGVHVLPHLPEQHLAALQRACRATIHPALDEGFGLPVLDALAAGGAVLVSDIPVLAELVPDPGARFDPRSPASIAAALRRLDQDAFVERLRTCAAEWAAPHTWDAAAARTLGAHDAALARRPVASRRRPRLAVITPLPPQRTGVAAFERHRLQALAELADVDVFAESADGAPAAAVPGVRVLDVDLVTPATQVEAYDVPVLHVIGNSQYHVQAWKHLMDRGGDLLLHDVRLVGLHGLLLENGIINAAAFAEAEASGTPGRLQADRPTERSPSPSVSGRPEAETLMCGQVVDRARRVLVHSQAARRMVLTVRPERAADVYVVPLATPPLAPPSAARKPREVAAFGFVKDVERLARMLATLITRDPSIRGAIVGGPHVGDEQRLSALLTDLGIAESVEVTGWMDDDTWTHRLRTATVAVQLREGWNGEASGTVAECLAAGVPTVVNDVGAYEDLPDDVIVKVPASVEAASLAQTVEQLLGDEQRRERLSTSAESFAGRRSMRHAATSLLEAILGPPAPRAGAPADEAATSPGARVGTVAHANAAAVRSAVEQLGAAKTR